MNDGTNVTPLTRTPPTPEEIRARQQAAAARELTVTKASLPALPSTDQQVDSWEEAAKEGDGRLIQGTRLGFSDGAWSIGKEQTAFDTARRLIALGTLTAWVRWEAQKPAEIIVKQAGKPFPEREDLQPPVPTDGVWPNNPDGSEGKDPWQRTMHLYLCDETTSAGYTFASSSWGAKSSITDLAVTIRNHRYKEPGALPIVTLGSAPFKTRFGLRKKPAFDIVGWTGVTGPETRPDAPLTKVVEAKAEDSGKPYDDEIPF
jgi:hypothetical protein